MKYYSTLALFIFIFSHVSLVTKAADPEAENTIQLTIHDYIDKL